MAFSSFEFPTGSFRTWVDVDAAKGLILEQLRYESWECTEVPGQSLVEMTHVEILVNGTAITDTQCLLLTVSEDLQTSNQIYFSCDEEPALDSFGYTNTRLNSTVVAAPSGPDVHGFAGVAGYVDGWQSELRGARERDEGDHESRRLVPSVRVGEPERVSGLSRRWWRSLQPGDVLIATRRILL